MITRRTALLAGPAIFLAACLGGAAAYVATRSEPVVGIGGPFSLLDGDGHTVTERVLRGRISLVYFGYTHCPDACPTALADMVSARDLVGQDVQLIFISIDPERDTPAVVKDYVSAFDAPILALSGPADAVAAAARGYRVYFAKHPTKDGYDMDHSSIIYVMGRDGRFVANFTHETPPQQMAARITALL